LTAALKTVRHLRGDRVLCLPDGTPITRDRVIKAVRGAQRVAGIEHELAEHEEWAREFETSQDPLSKLAAEARSDRTGSRVTDIDPDRL